jgi:hypothetical protein
LLLRAKALPQAVETLPQAGQRPLDSSFLLLRGAVGQTQGGRVGTQIALVEEPQVEQAALLGGEAQGLSQSVREVAVGQLL